MGSFAPAREDVQALRPYRGAIEAARRLRAFVAGQRARRVARELRPRAGRVLAALRRAGAGRARGTRSNTSRSQLTIELNAVNDNPLVFADAGEVISAGLFHAQPVALVDRLSQDRGGRSGVAERAAHRSPAGSRASPNCRPCSPVEPGIESGYMLAQYTAAALVSENKVLCHPASVDSIPTGAGDRGSREHGADRRAPRAQGGRERVARGGARTDVRVPRARIPPPAHRRLGQRAAVTPACGGACPRPRATARSRGDCERARVRDPGRRTRHGSPEEVLAS